MCSVNAYLIQDKIKQLEHVTVPWIQKEYGLDYKEAKEFLTFLQRRGWIESHPIGIEYLVIHNNLQLRRIVREEVDGLVEDITSDCIAALTCMQKRSTCGASYSEIEAAVRGDDDTKDAIKILNNHKLICLFQEMYFTTVSKRTIGVLSDVVSEKRKNEANKRLSGKVENNKQLGKLFDVLFDDQ